MCFESLYKNCQDSTGNVYFALSTPKFEPYELKNIDLNVIGDEQKVLDETL